MTETVSDEALMLRVLKQDHQAFEVLYKRRKDGVYRQVYVWVGMDHHTAEDIAQQTWIAIASAKNYEPSAKFMTWALTIARNKMLTWQASARFKHEQVLKGGEDEGEDPMDRVPSGTPPMECALFREQCASILLRCIERLTPDQRAVLVCKEGNDLTSSEVGALLEKNSNTVRNLLAKAYKNLRACVEGTLGRSVDDIVAGFT